MTISEFSGITRKISLVVADVIRVSPLCRTLRESVRDTDGRQCLVKNQRRRDALINDVAAKNGGGVKLTALLSSHVGLENSVRTVIRYCWADITTPERRYRSRVALEKGGNAWSLFDAVARLEELLREKLSNVTDRT